MKYLLFIYIVFSSVIYADILTISDDIKYNDVLKHSQVYIDKTKSLSIKEISKLTNVFEDNKEEILSYGYAPDFEVWIKFTLKNVSDKPLSKILEYDNPLTTHITLFIPDKMKTIKEGLYQRQKDRKTINPIFRINFEPYETKTYYMRVSSHITTLIIKLNLYSYEHFYEEEIQHQLILALFFGAMLVLGIYNLFIYFFTKDISYLYYVLYLFGIIFHHIIYIGMGNVYIFNQKWIINFIEVAVILVAFPIFFLGLFTKTFLHIEQYPKNSKILDIFLILFPVITIIFMINEELSSYRNYFTLFLLFYLVGLTVYAAVKKNRPAYFILFGWFIILLAGSSMFFSSVGVFNIQQYLAYFVEVAFVLEAIVFSIALADRIKYLQKDKDDVTQKLILQKENEQSQLRINVEEKTKNLTIALDEKELLLKELNHRVKNNMQTIISLIRLQTDETQDPEIQDVLTTTYNRINAMSELHELLYYQNDITNINANTYFRVLVNEIQDAYSQTINLHLDITCMFKVEEAISCGLILNELVTNAFKYAFEHNNGNIYINLSKKFDEYTLKIKDDGRGYKQSSNSSSLGLIIVDSLVKNKLRGTITSNSKNGVEVMIIWRELNG